MLSSHPSIRHKQSTFESRANEIFHMLVCYARNWNNHSRAITDEDLAQEALIRIWKAYSNYQPGTYKFSTYVYSIAKNVFIDICKSPSNILSDSYEPLKASPSFTVDSKASSEDFFNGRAVHMNGISVDSFDDLYPAYIHHLMSPLTERQHLIVEKTFGVGNQPWEQSDRSIAEDLGITRQTVSSDRKKAIETMRLRAIKRTPLRCAS